jgi:hypothetical protein
VGWVERTSGRVEGRLPSPAALLAERPYLFELLTLAELAALDLDGQAGAVLIERVVRPWFFWLWLWALARALLGGRQRLAVAAATALVWLAVGALLLVGARAAAPTCGPFILLVPVAAAVAARAMSASRVVRRGSVW